MKSILYAVLVIHLDYCLGATSIIHPDNLKVVGLGPGPNELEERSLWDEVMLVSRMTSALERRDILDALIVGVKVGEIIPGLPKLLQKCLKMWERTLTYVQPVFWGAFPKTKPPGAKAVKLPFKIPHVHIKVSIIFKLVRHVIQIIQHPQILVSDGINLPKMLIKSGEGIIKSPMKLVKGITKSPMKYINGLMKLPTKLMSGAIKSPMKLLNIGKSAAMSPFKMLEHILRPGQTKENKKSKKKYHLNFNYMNMLGKVLKHPHMGDEPPKEKNEQLKDIVQSSET